MIKHTILSAALAVALALPAAADTIRIVPGDDAQEQAQEALILAQPGDTIEFAEGTYNFTRTLSLDVANVTVVGQGMDKTVWSFATQDSGAEGLLVTSDGVTLKDFAIEDTKGDAIKVNGVTGVSFIGVRTEWTGGPKETNGAYGLYPVASDNVLIDGCVAIGASDAGIYVGQSRNIVLRNSRAEFNVAGIEIENCYDADVHDNIATHNAGGILVFDLPGIPQQGGHNVRVFNNKSVDNDTPNFAPEGNIVGEVPTGSGLIIMANHNVEVFGNTLSGNATTNVMIVAYNSTDRPITDPNYYPLPEGIHIHNNTMSDCGSNPTGHLGELIASIAGTPVPDIVWDGIANPEKFVNGKPSPEQWIYIHDNGDADFVNLDASVSLEHPELANVSRDLTPHAGSMPALAAVVLPGLDAAGE